MSRNYIVYELLPKTKAFVFTNYIIFIFSVAILIALSAPYPGIQVYSVLVANKNHIFPTICTFIVFLISGITLKINELQKTLQHKTSIVLGILVINFFTTLQSFALVRLPLSSQEFSNGLAIFAACPTTLGT
jgi:predicted Na+-dependent transporter